MINHKPQRPFKSFSAFRQYIHRGDTEKLKDSNFFPCLECDGCGKVRSIDDLDPIEGYKLAPWYKCKACKGSGRTSRKLLIEAYIKEINKYRKDRDRWKIAEQLRQQALSKLSEEEKRVLKLES